MQLFDKNKVSTVDGNIVANDRTNEVATKYEVL